MLKEICKRDGRVVPFKTEKITEAIFKAAQAVGGEDRRLAEKLTGEVVNILEGKEIKGLIPTVEEVQDAVEKILIENGHARTAKAYILYRDKRTRIREAKSELMDVVKEILLETEERRDEHFWSHKKKMLQIAGAVSNKYYLENLLPREMADAHNEGKVFIYGLHYYSKAPASFFLRCERLKQNIISKRNIMEFAFEEGQLIKNVQEDLHEEITLANFDCLFQGYLLHKKGLTKNVIPLALESFLKSLTGGKMYTGLPVSFNMGLDTSPWGKETCMALLDYLEHNPHDNMSVIFQTEQNTNRSRTSVNYDLYLKALKMAREGKNIYFSFQDSSFNKQTTAVYSPSCQRAELGSKAGMASVAALGVNLPLLAFSTKSVDLFFVQLDRLLRFASLQLIHRLEVLSHLKVKDLPQLMSGKHYNGIRKLREDDNIGTVLRQGTLGLRFYGLKDIILQLPEWGGSCHPSSLSFTEKILGHIQKRAAQLSKEYNLNFSLSAAPGDNASQVFKKKNKEHGIKEATKDLYAQEEMPGGLQWEAAVHSSFQGGHISFIQPQDKIVQLEAMLEKTAGFNLGLVKVGVK